MAVTPYDLLEEPKLPGGAWTYTGTLAPFPAAPVTYDGSIDTTGYALGVYEYTYTVTGVGGCMDSSTVDIALIDEVEVRNDHCVDALTLPIQDVGYSNGIVGGTLGNIDCASPYIATQSPETFPTNWGAPATVSGDVWYKVVIGSNPVSDYSVIIYVSGDPYPADGIVQPLVAMYTGTSCGVITEVCSSSPIADPSVKFTDCSAIIGPPDTDVTIYVRVAASLGGNGIFDLNVITNPAI